MFHPNPEKWSNLTNIFSDGLVQPPTIFSYWVLYRMFFWDWLNSKNIPKETKKENGYVVVEAIFSLQDVCFSSPNPLRHIASNKEFVVMDLSHDLLGTPPWNQVVPMAGYLKPVTIRTLEKQTPFLNWTMSMGGRIKMDLFVGSDFGEPKDWFEVFYQGNLLVCSIPHPLPTETKTRTCACI